MTVFNNEKLYYSISEASDELSLDQHVLRFWEKQFKQIQPTKAKNRRLYTKEDLAVIKKIKDLLYNKGYTIKGVQKYLQNKNNSQDSDLSDQDRQQAIMESIKQLREIQTKLESKL